MDFFLRAALLPAALVTIGCAAAGDGGGDATTSEAAHGYTGYTIASGAVELRFDADAVGGTWRITQGSVAIEVAVTKQRLLVPGDAPETLFSPLAAGPADWVIEQDGTTQATGTVTVGERFTHFFDQQVPADVTLTSASAHIAVGETVAISGTTGAGGARKDASIGLPDGGAKTIQLADAALGPNSAFSFEIAADAPGLLVIELTLPSGLPAAVIGVHVGDTVPLATSRLDAGFTGAKVVDPAAASADVLGRVNALRSGLGLPPFGAHPKLSQTAQKKAEDMATQDYFAHVSPSGETAGDLAEQAGLTGSIYENLAVESSAERAYLGWYWSPVHRSALVSTTFVSHGLGVAAFRGQHAFVQHMGTEAAP